MRLSLDGVTGDELINRVIAADYAGLFQKEFGYDVATMAASDPGRVYNDIANAIAAFERSGKVNKFSSKFDKFVDEQAGKGIDVSTIVLSANGGVVGWDGTTAVPVTSTVFMQEELEGLALFNMPNNNDGILDNWEGSGKEGGNCAACHPTAGGPIVFTDFSYDNLGIPVNETAYKLHYGTDGPWPPDMGLYDTVTMFLGYDVGSTQAISTIGLFKVPTLRNVAVTEPYGHNGFFQTLYSIVHFYNKRMVEDLGDPEIGEPNEEELGNLGLLKAHEEKIVIFMETLTDE